MRKGKLSSGELNIHKIDGEEEVVELGSQLLKLAIDYDQLLMKGLTHEVALSVLRRKRGDYTPELLDAFTIYIGICPEDSLERYTYLSVNELNIGIVFAEDVRDRYVELIISKDQDQTGGLCSGKYGYKSSIFYYNLYSREVPQKAWRAVC